LDILSHDRHMIRHEQRFCSSKGFAGRHSPHTKKAKRAAHRLKFLTVYRVMSTMGATSHELVRTQLNSID
jgi:hypothetical protein